MFSKLSSHPELIALAAEREALDTEEAAARADLEAAELHKKRLVAEQSRSYHVGQEVLESDALHEANLALQLALGALRRVQVRQAELAERTAAHTREILEVMKASHRDVMREGLLTLAQMAELMHEQRQLMRAVVGESINAFEGHLPAVPMHILDGPDDVMARKLRQAVEIW
jgi:hypothetical protein